jgi:hypothetical protein
MDSHQAATALAQISDSGKLLEERFTVTSPRLNIAFVLNKSIWAGSTLDKESERPASNEQS